MTQEIAVSVKGDKVECAINGRSSAATTRPTLVTAGKLKSTDGVYGIRFAHNTEGTVSGLDGDEELVRCGRRVRTEGAVERCGRKVRTRRCARRSLSPAKVATSSGEASPKRPVNALDAKAGGSDSSIVTPHSSSPVYPLATG